MDNLLLAPHTRSQLKALLADMPHAVLLTGPIGMGKLTIAQAIASELTASNAALLIQPDDKSTISIEVIRPLYRSTRAKQTAHQVIIVDHAESMGTEAQNAFLKLLEEPRAGVTFILTAPTDDSLLPTITSRTQNVIIQPCTQAELQQFMNQHNPDLTPQEQAQLLFVANGRPAVVARLCRQPEVFEHFKQLMKRAKDMLAADSYTRLAQVTQLTKDRQDAIVLLEAMARMVQLQLLRNPTPQWVGFADRLELCLGRLAQNGNLRTQLTALFTQY
jgi:DNA polymerase-3 subunit delta'